MLLLMMMMMRRRRRRRKVQAPVPLAAWSLAYTFLFFGFAGLNPARGMDFCHYFPT
jgi:hypothetical protein